MLLSMTGYGRHSLVTEKYSIDIEIKSLNSRFLDLSLRLPRELSHYEYNLRDLFKSSKIIRGKVALSLNLSYNKEKFNEFAVDEVNLKKIIQVVKKIQSFADISEDVSLGHLMLFRDIFLTQEEADEFDFNQIKEAVNIAIDDLLRMRELEGAELKNDIEYRLGIIEKYLTKIEDLADSATKEYFEKFREKALKLSDEFINDENRFLIELGILSEKHDVTEESTRLRSHLKLFYETLNKSSDIGRKLNFICQEMNREINTINSKSISSEISHLGINIKEELEKIREQVQNIE